MSSYHATSLDTPLLFPEILKKQRGEKLSALEARRAIESLREIKYYENIFTDYVEEESPVFQR